MSNESPDSSQSNSQSLPAHIRLSLCAACTQCKIVRSGKGSVFLLCELGLKVAHWPKYPPQPVVTCRNYLPTISAE